MSVAVKDVTDRQTRMEKAKEPYISLMDWNIKVAVPSREKISAFKTDDAGMLKGRNIWDPTAAASLETWKNGMMGWHTPRATNWFAQQAQDRTIRDNRNVVDWLQQVDEQMTFALNRSNYYEMKGIRMIDSGGIGPSYMFADEIVESGKIQFRVPHPRQFYHELDFFGLVNKMHYNYELPMREAIRTFGKAWMSQEQRLTEKDNPDQAVKIIQAIYKNNSFDPEKSNSGLNRPWISRTINLVASDGDGGTEMEQSGYNTINPVPWLLNRSTHELYPRGVVGQFIIEIMTSNYMMRDMLSASQQAVRPALIGLDTLRAKLNPKAGGMTWVDSNDIRGAGSAQMVARLIEGIDWPFGLEMIDRFQGVIEQRFGVPFFLLMNSLEGGERTATEILQRQAERAVLMTPFLGTLNSITDMELDRVFDIEFTAGRMPEPPQELLASSNRRIDIQYTGPLTQLIKQHFETNKIRGAVASLDFLLAIDPQVAINMDLDVMAQELLSASGAPVDAIVPLRDVKEIRLALANQAAQQTMVDRAEQLNLPGVLAEADKQVAA